MQLSRQNATIGVVVLLLAAALLLMVASVLGRSELWSRLFAPEADGNWAGVSIDGRGVAPQQYRIVILDGEVSGGRDGCNDWSYDDEGADEKGGRRITSTLVGCPEGDPVREAYWALTTDPDIDLREDGSLRVASRGHQAIWRRCEWETVRVAAPATFSETRECIPK